MPDGWTEVWIGRHKLYASVNYRGNIVLAEDPTTDGQRDELIVDLEYQKVIVL